ncbi:protein midgut expression 1 [Scaptodrosophila lebanonensis]|uniref:Protein midgut expression 1 n=1 Tax=Drosophila lebanonensis TaxID=7225 RepID=A0A6J2UHI7_DROLE|nr:protein midgut expression 1 [Scaptodrosophila lebanonensis]
MCNALWECIKCPGKVVCCCCECACKMLMSIICSGIILLVVIGLIVYFAVYYNKDSSTPEQTAKSIEPLKQSFRHYFKSLNEY